MGRFSFRVEACEASIDGFDGVMLAGPVLDRAFNFGVGDTVVVPTDAGQAQAECVALVLARWGPGREDWLTITVNGVDSTLVTRGGVAYAERE